MTNKNNDFNFPTRESAIALYLDAVESRKAFEAQLNTHEAYMSSLCEAMLNTFGTVNETTGKKSLQLDLGDGSARGHIVVERERKDDDGNKLPSLFFIRERNTGRPQGSKNKVSKSAPPAAETAEEQPTVVVEEASEVSAEAKPTLTPMEIAYQTVEQEEREAAAAAAAPKSADPVADAILNVAQTAIEALKVHSSRSVAPAASAAE